MATSAMRSRTVWRPGRNEARTRHARAPRRRSRLAGWTWSFSKGVSAVIAPLAIRASMAWQGRMPGREKSLMGGEALAGYAEGARGGGGGGCGSDWKRLHVDSSEDRFRVAQLKTLPILSAPWGLRGNGFRFDLRD